MKRFLFLSVLIIFSFGELFAQSASFQGISFTGEKPPDPVIAAGPNHIVLVANGTISFYTKTGTLVSSTDLNSWFSSVIPPGNPFDPKVIYDHLYNRFVVLALSHNTGFTLSSYLVAVSQSSDPTAGWYFKNFDARLDNTTNTNNWADFPGLGYDDEAVYITSNQMYIYGQGDFQYSKVRALKKSQLYSGSSTDYKDFIGMDNPTTNGTKAKDIKPAHQFGLTTGYYLMNTSSVNSPNFVNVWRIDDPFGTIPTITIQASINIAAYISPPAAVQKGNTETIDTKDCRISDVIYRDGYLYGAFTAARSGGNGSVIRILKISTTNNSLIWDETYGGGYGIYYYYPEIYPDQDGDVVMVFNKSSANDYAGVAWAFRMSSDVSMSSSKWLQEGGGSYVNILNNINRWGDYNGICLDPSDGNKIWIYGEYATSTITNWSTWVGCINTELLLTFTNFIGDDNAGGTLTVNTTPPINSGEHLPLEIGSPNNVKTNNERFGNWNSSGINYKHNNWNDASSEYFLNHNFTANYGTDEFQNANYIKLDYSKIEARLEGSFISGKGNFQFQDPWYVKGDGTQPGNYWIPAIGMYEPTGKEGATEKGVFLDQSGPPLWTPPYYSVKTDLIQDILLQTTGIPAGRIHKFYFQNWSGTDAEFEDENSSETGVVFTSENATVTANLKGTQLSNYSDAYNNNGQRKFLRTPDGRLHLTYESLNTVWYEMSENNAQSWEIVYTPTLTESSWSSHQPSLSYYQDGADKIHVFMFYRLLRGEPNDYLPFVEYIYDSSPNPEFYESENLSPSNPIGGFTYTNPTVACAENGKTLFVWESTLNGVGQKLMYSYGKKLSSGGWDWYQAAIIIDITSNGAKNPTVVASQNLNDLKFHLAWNEGYEVYYTALYPDASNHLLNTGKQWVSNGSGYPYNNKPSIIEMSNIARISWIGSRFIDQQDQGTLEYKTILKNLGNNTYKRFGSNTTSVSLTRDEDNPEYFLAWSESNTHSNKFVTSDNFSQIYNLGVTGDYVKLSTGDDLNNISAMIYNTANQPYVFSKSSSLYDIMNPMNKITSLSINTGREGVVYIDTAQFYFAIGDLVIDNQTIGFVEIPDSVSIDSKETLNQYFTSNSFQVTDNSSFYYTVQYGITDSLTAYNLLGENDYINFKVELIDDLTGEIIGQFDDVVFSKTNLELYDNISYRVNTQGIGNRTVRLKLVTDNNFNPEYSISQMLSDEYVLGKQVINEINYKGSLKVDSYDLAQNYPNPFNPSTTIKYQIPNAGNVTLKVYDILGREVVTLVDEFKNEGRYEVNFNASKLASGVYIYTIKSNDFIASKKLMLLK